MSDKVGGAQVTVELLEGKSLMTTDLYEEWMS